MQNVLMLALFSLLENQRIEGSERDARVLSVMRAGAGMLVQRLDQNVKSSSVALRTMKHELVSIKGLGAAGGALPPGPAGLFSECGEEIKLHIEGSLTIPVTGI